MRRKGYATHPKAGLSFSESFTAWRKKSNPPICQQICDSTSLLLPPSLSPLLQDWSSQPIPSPLVISRSEKVLWKIMSIFFSENLSTKNIKSPLVMGNLRKLTQNKILSQLWRWQTNGTVAPRTFRRPRVSSRTRIKEHSSQTRNLWNSPFSASLESLTLMETSSSRRKTASSSSKVWLLRNRMVSTESYLVCEGERQKNVSLLVVLCYS